MPLQTATVRVAINANASLDSGNLLGNAQTTVDFTTTYATGTADGNADTSFTRVYSVTTSPTTIDINAGTITQPDGTVATFAEITTLFIQHNGTAGTITVGGGSNPVANVSDVIGIGGCRLYHEPTSGMAVTAATADILTFTASAGTISMKVVILGRSA